MSLISIGPGFDDIDPSENYTFISDSGNMVPVLEHAGGTAEDVLRSGGFLSHFLGIVDL